jgi:uncharacterized membrane protein
MTREDEPSKLGVASVIFNLLDPIPFGFFVAVMIFDIVYAKGGDLLWVKSAAWLVSIGLVIAIVPRLINLWYVWFRKHRATSSMKIDFWLNLLGILAALVNAFVHSRDAYAAIPDAVYLSVATVVLLALGRIVLASRNIGFREFGHE